MFIKLFQSIVHMAKTRFGFYHGSLLIKVLNINTNY
jgi:hypothetical protein